MDRPDRDMDGGPAGAASRHPADPNDMYAKVRDCLEEGRYTEAGRRLQAIDAGVPRDTTGCLLWMRLLAANRRADTAIALAERWLASRDDDNNVREGLRQLRIRLARSAREPERPQLRAETPPGVAHRNPVPINQPVIIQPSATAADHGPAELPRASDCGGESPIPESPGESGPVPRTATPGPQHHLDRGDLASFGVLLLHATPLLVLALRLPNALHNHPLPLFITDVVPDLLSNALLRHLPEVAAGVAVFVALALMIDSFGRRAHTEGTLVLEALQRPWGFHWRWTGLLLAVVASLVANAHADRVLVPGLIGSRDLSLALGLAACALAPACAWTLLPGIRWRLRLVRIPAQPKLNYLAVRRIFPVPTVDYLYVRDLLEARARFSLPVFLLTGSGALELELRNGTVRRIAAPTSIARLEMTVLAINAVVLESVITSEARNQKSASR